MYVMERTCGSTCHFDKEISIFYLSADGQYGLLMFGISDCRQLFFGLT